MKFLIRDDDTCGVTCVKDLERCYASVWKYAPVCFSVTPFRIPYKADWIPKRFFGSLDPVALDENKELTSFIKDGLYKGWMDVALHGFHHIVTSASQQKELFDAKNILHVGREYFYGDGLREKTIEGKKYLEKVLGYKVNTFVPPGNAISKQGLRAIIEQELNLVGSPSLNPLRLNQRSFNPRNYLNAFKKKLWEIRHKKNFNYPFILDFKNHKEISYISLTPKVDLGQLCKNIDFVHSVNGIFVLSLHYHAFPKKIQSGETIGDTFHKILDKIASIDNVEFITYRELWL